jgi:transcription antitermination factor NusA-like protein
VLGEEKVKAIGKWGANINLAVELTGYKIHLVSNDDIA